MESNKHSTKSQIFGVICDNLHSLVFWPDKITLSLHISKPWPPQELLSENNCINCKVSGYVCFILASHAALSLYWSYWRATEIRIAWTYKNTVMISSFWHCSIICYESMIASIPCNKSILNQEEIKRRFNSGNACNHSVQDLLSFCLVLKHNDWTIFLNVLYGCETWSDTEEKI
jgi:hypothetical protein